jgi:hypothetical protein
MANQQITPAQQSMAFSIAAIALATSVLDAAIKRGDITTGDARAVISNGRNLLQKSPSREPEERIVFDAAEEALRLAEAFLAMGAAQAPPQGRH